MQYPFHALVAALIALLPAAFAQWSGRRLIAIADDPAFAERLLVTRTRASAVAVVTWIALVVIASDQVWWTLPLLVLSTAVARYRVRRVLYEERWSFIGYFGFFARLSAAVFGFWFVIAFAPLLMSLTGSRDWIVAGALLVVLIAWSRYYAPIFSVIVRAHDLADPVIVERFHRMARDAKLERVVLKQVDVNGGMFANAVALPQLKQPTVLISSTLVDRLDRDETVAILAHELAHIEHYDKRRLRIASTVTLVLAAASMALPLFVHRTFPLGTTLLASAWPILLFVALAARGQHRQANETASDLRAIALCGDAEALIRALTKLHVLSRVPRRWDTEFERRATHPSLARRIQAIRGASGSAGGTLGQATQVSSQDGAASVTFLDDRIVWNESATTSYSIEYGRLTMLRIDANMSEAARLVAVDADARRWTMTVKPDDVARAQAALDVIDARLGRIAPPPATPPQLSRLIAVIAVSVSMTQTTLAAFIVGALSLWRPVAPFAAALGATSLVGAAMTRGFLGDEPLFIGMLVVCGLALLTLSVINRREQVPVWTDAVVALLAVLAVAALAAFGASGLSVIDLNQSAHEWPSAATLPAAVAAAAIFNRRRPVRLAAVPFALASLIVLIVGSTPFFNRFANDPFIAPAEPAQITTLQPESQVAEMPVPVFVEAVRVSPRGGYVAVFSGNEDDDAMVHAGRVGRPLTSFGTADAEFIDEGRLLLLEPRANESVLRIVRLDAPTEDEWSLRVPVRHSDLLVDRSSGHWSLLGWNDGRQIVAIEGSAGNDTYQQTIWKGASPENAYLSAISNVKGELLAIERHTHVTWAGRALPEPWSTLAELNARQESRFWSLTDRERSPWTRSRTDVNCRRTSMTARGTICAAFDGTTTRLFAVDSEARQLRALATIHGRIFMRGGAGDGWLGVWLEGQPVQFHVGSGTMFRLAVPDQRSYVNAFAIGDSVIAASTVGGRGSVLRFYNRTP